MCGITTINITPEILAQMFIQDAVTNMTCIDGVPKESYVTGWGYDPSKRTFYIEYSRDDNLFVTFNPTMQDNTQLKVTL